MAAKPNISKLSARDVLSGALLATALAVLAVAYFRFVDARMAEGFAQTPGAAPRSKPIPQSDLDVYLINLDRNADRLAAFIKQYGACDLRALQFKRLSAVDGSKLDEDEVRRMLTPKAWDEIQEIERTGYRTKHYQLTRGGVGCYLSHYKVYEQIAKGDKPYGLIFEDDVTIDRKIHARLNQVITTLPDDWDVLLMSCHCIVCEKQDSYYDTGRFWWLHCYVVKRAAAQRLVAELDVRRKRISQQIDSELSDMIAARQLRVLCLKEPLCKQGNAFQTTIQTPLKVVAGVDPFTTVTDTVAATV